MEPRYHAFKRMPGNKALIIMERKRVPGADIVTRLPAVWSSHQAASSYVRNRPGRYKVMRCDIEPAECLVCTRHLSRVEDQ